MEKERRKNDGKKEKNEEEKTLESALTPGVDLRLLDGRLPQQLRRGARGLAGHEARDRVRLEHAALGRLERRHLPKRIQLEKLGRLVRLAHLEARDIDRDSRVLCGDEGLVGVLVSRVGVELELGGHGCCFLCCLRNRERDGGRRRLRKKKGSEQGALSRDEPSIARVVARLAFASPRLFDSFFNSFVTEGVVVTSASTWERESDGA